MQSAIVLCTPYSSGVTTDSYSSLGFTDVFVYVSPTAALPECLCLYKQKSGYNLGNIQIRPSISRMINDASFIRPKYQSATMKEKRLSMHFALVVPLSARTEHTKP